MTVMLRGFVALQEARVIKIPVKIIKRDAERIFKYKAYYLDDSEIVVIAYGITGRSALEAVRRAREEGRKVGFLRLITLWPSAV